MGKKGLIRGGEEPLPLLPCLLPPVEDPIPLDATEEGYAGVAVELG